MWVYGVCIRAYNTGLSCSLRLCVHEKYFSFSFDISVDISARLHCETFVYSSSFQAFCSQKSFTHKTLSVWAMSLCLSVFHTEHSDTCRLRQGDQEYMVRPWLKTVPLCSLRWPPAGGRYQAPGLQVCGFGGCNSCSLAFTLLCSTVLLIPCLYLQGARVGSMQHSTWLRAIPLKPSPKSLFT